VARYGADTEAGAHARLMLLELRRRGLFETEVGVLTQYVTDIEALAHAFIQPERIRQAALILHTIAERDRLYEETRQMIQAQVTQREQERLQAMQRGAEPEHKRLKQEEEPANNNAPDEVEFVLDDVDYPYFIEDAPVPPPPPVPDFDDIPFIAANPPTLYLMPGGNVQDLSRSPRSTPASVYELSWW